MKKMKITNKKSAELLCEFINKHFYSSLIREGFVPFAKDKQHYVKWLNKDVLAFIYFALIPCGDFEVYYGAKTLVNMLPIKLTRFDTHSYYSNEMYSAEYKVREDPNRMRFWYYPLLDEYGYEDKIEVIAKQLEKAAFPELRESIPPCEVAKFAKKGSHITCYEYLYGDKASFMSKLKELIDDTDRMQIVAEWIERHKELKQNLSTWDARTCDAALNARFANDWAIFDSFVEECREYNLTLLKKHVPLLFD